MARNFKYTTLDRVLSKLYRDLGLEEISETDVVEWAGEALEGIGVVSIYDEAVAFIGVENHQATLPNGLHSIIQVAKSNYPKEEICPANVVADVIETTEVTVETCPVPLDCKGNLLEQPELAYYRPYFDLQYEYHGWNSSKIRQGYSPLRLANHSFFNSVVCSEDDSLYSTSTEEYTLQDDQIRTSFKEGQIAIAYTKQRIDEETGYPMIPDDYSIITAITMYITMKYMSRLWYMGREGYADKMQKSESDWQWYCKQASNRAMMPHGVDAYQNILEEKDYLIPRHNKYYGFFGKLGRAEDKRFKDPNNRNHNRNYRNL